MVPKRRVPKLVEFGNFWLKPVSYLWRSAMRLCRAFVVALSGLLVLVCSVSAQTLDTPNGDPTGPPIAYSNWYFPGLYSAVQPPGPSGLQGPASAFACAFPWV